MELHADFTKRVVMHGDDLEWVDTPMKGVQRRMLDRIGGEVARATTIVKYAPDSHFSSHVHTGGEEFIVLEGVFQDEHGDFPVGSYVRNPPESSHTPGSEPGCVIFVKLWQFDLSDRTHVIADMNKLGGVEPARQPGSRVSPLFKDSREDVRMEQWKASDEIGFKAAGGAEIFVLDGGFRESDDQLKKHSWLRVPNGYTVNATAGPDGARVWIKTGHLKYAEAPAVIA